MISEAILKQDKERLLASWKAVFGEFDAIKKASDDITVRWEWTTGERYSSIPLYFLRKSHNDPGEVWKEKPEEVIGNWLYGFDKSERILSQRHYHGEEFSEFYSYEKDFVQIVHFMPYEPYSSLPMEISHFYFENGQVVRYGSFKLSGVQFPPPRELNYTSEGVLDWLDRKADKVWQFSNVYWHEIYNYEGEKLSRVQVWSNFVMRPEKDNYELEEHIIYDGSNQVKRIDSFVKGKRYRVLYQRPDFPFEVIRQNTKSLILDLVPKALKKAQIPDHVFTVVLYWHVEDMFNPLPLIYWVSDKERRELSNRMNFEDLWYPHTHYVDLDLDNASEDIRQLYEQEAIRKIEWEGTHSLYREVAAELALTKNIWTQGVIETADDFVVYVMEIDLHVDDLEEALLSSVDKKQIERWQAAGCLPNDMREV